MGKCSHFRELMSPVGHVVKLNSDNHFAKLSNDSHIAIFEYSSRSFIRSSAKNKVLSHLLAARMRPPTCLRVSMPPLAKACGLPAGEDAAADDGDAGADGVAERAADGDPQRVLLRRLPRRRGASRVGRLRSFGGGAPRRGGSGRTAGSRDPCAPPAGSEQVE